MQTNSNFRNLMTISFAASILIPLVLITIFAYLLMASIGESANNKQLGKVFTINVLEYNHWKSYLANNTEDEKNREAALIERLNDIKFKPSDKIFLKVDGVYKNLENPDEKVDFSIVSVANIYADSSLAIKNYKRNQDIFISFQQSSGEGLVMISDVRYDKPIYPSVIGRLILVITAIVISVILVANAMIKSFGEPEEKIEKALNVIKRGELKKGFVEYEKGEEFYEIYEVYNSIVKLENKNIEMLVSKTTGLQRELESIEASLFSAERTLENIEENKRYLEATDRQMEDIVNTVVDIIFKLDENMNIVNVNREFEKLMECDAKSVQGRSIFEFIDFRDIEINDENFEDIRQSFLIFLKRRSVKKIVIRLKKNGRVFGEEYTMTLKNIESGVDKIGYQGICRSVDNIDATDEFTIRRSYELNQMREINKMLSESENLDKTIGDIVGKISSFSSADIVTVRLIENDRLVLRYYRDTSKAITIFDTENFGTELLEKIFEGEGIYLSKNSEELVKEPHSLVEHILTICNYVNIIPIKHNEERVGVVMVNYYSQPDDSVGRILHSLAGQIAIAIYKNRLYDKQKIEYMNTIKALAAAVEAKDEYTQGHSERVSELSKMVAVEMGLDSKLIEEIEISGILHDIGKIGIADAILLKPGKLTDDEFARIKDHPSLGYKIIEPIGLSKPIVDGILLHHMRYDRSGYPGEEYLEGELTIAPLIIGAADAFDAITSKRSYSGERPIIDAILELERCSGDQFAPEVVASFRRIYDNNPELIEKICQNKSSWNVKLEN